MKKFWAENFLLCELVLGSLAGLSLALVSEVLNDGEWATDFLVGSNGNFYAALAQINAALLGFAIAAAAIIVTAAPDDRLTELRRSDHFDDIWQIFRSAVRFLGAATLLSLFGLLLQDGVASRIIFYLTIGFSAVAALRIARCIWAMNWVIKIFMKGSYERPAGG